jgi:hypothetical protein
MKIGAFLDIAPCNLGVDRRFRGVHCLHHQGDVGPDDGGNVGQLEQDYTALYPRSI